MMMDYMEKLEKLDKQGHNYLNQGQWEEAANTFQELLRIDDNPVVRNNLAYALNMNGLHPEALAILEPALESDVISPFSRALAAIVLVNMGKEKEGSKYLRDAINQFDNGVRNPSKWGFKVQGWREYTVIIKRAAGYLGDHRLVLDLHRKWERYYQTREDVFQAGVALFNLGYPTRAAKIWSRIADRDWRFLQAYIQTAEAVDRGFAPGFTLPYSPPELGKQDERISDEDMRRELLHGGTRALFLAQLFDQTLPEEVIRRLVEILVSIDDDWGIAFGQSILESNSLPTEWKMAAAIALTNRGVFKEDEEIPMLIDGVSRVVVLKVRTFDGPASPEQLERLKDIQALLNKECYDEALDLLELDLAENDLPLEGFELLGKLYAVLGNREKAEMIVDIFLDLAETRDDFDIAHIVVTDIYLRLGDLETANEYFEQISFQNLPEGLKKRYGDLQMQLEG